MRPRLQFLDAGLVDRVLEEAFQLLRDPGVRVAAPEAAAVLADAGIGVEDGVARIPREAVEGALKTAPREFFLYDREGREAVRYGGDAIHFDPGSSCLNLLDPATGEARPATAGDLVRLVKVAEMLPDYSAQSTAMVCSDVPPEIGDFYRLLLVLWYSGKPVVSGAFSARTLAAMLELLEAECGGAARLRQRPRAVFDVCPSPPLNWSEFASYNLVALARAGVPAEMVAMPIAGGTAPVTLAGSVVQHAAECLSGIVIHQLAAPGAPIVWGGAPAVLDMRTGSAAMGAIETAMLNCACAEVGKRLGMPTHGYLVATDSKRVDAQAGLESAMSAAFAALTGINMISGAGMLDSLACHSLEKLVIDAEVVGYAQRAARGLEPRTADLALSMFAQSGLSGDFLRLPVTRREFRYEQYLPSNVIERGSGGEGPATDAYSRARGRVEELAASYAAMPRSEENQRAMLEIARREAARVGMSALPEIPEAVLAG